MNENDRRDEIGTFYAAHKERGKSFTVQHFKGQNVPLSTIYSIMNRVDKGQSLNRKPGSGRKKIILSPNSNKRMRDETIGKIAKGKRPLSQILKVSPNTVSRILKDNNIERKKRKTTPKITADQENRQTKRLRKLRRTLFQTRNAKVIIMDDESYFKFRDDHYSKHYYTDGNAVNEAIEYQTREKFPKKLMVWLAVSEKGHSTPYFHVSKGAINAKVYIELI